MPSCPIRRGQACLTIAVVATTLALAAPGSAQQHAHTHGHLAMDVAVDAQAITLRIESPLDGFLGFERAPRSDAERKRVADMVASLTAAERLFIPDPAAACKLAKVELASAVLGLAGDGKGNGREGKSRDPGGDHGHGHDDDHDHDDDHGDNHDHDQAGAAGRDAAGGEHADIDVNVTFTCARAAEARFIDIRLFEAYERIQTIDAQIASPQGQFKRTVKADAPRLSWGR